MKNLQGQEPSLPSYLPKSWTEYYKATGSLLNCWLRRWWWR